MLRHRMKPIIKRSACPISFTLDILGDKWSLLILRDMIFAGKSAYGEFLSSDEKIATNILADRLSTLESQGIINKTVSSSNKSKFVYTLTEKGGALLPVIMEITVWGAQYSGDGGNEQLLRALKKDKKGTIKEFAKRLRKKSSPIQNKSA
jgi:DNA-binding HxlR family transcriptional regulator